MLSDQGALFPQFATHNAHSIASACVAASGRPFELQRLHGMGEALYDEMSAAAGSTPAAASMRRSAATTTSSPTWCAACSRTAPTPPSSTAWPTIRRHLDEILRDPVQAVRARARQAGAPAAAADGHLLARAPEQPRHRARPSRPCAPRFAEEVAGDAERLLRGRRPSSAARRSRDAGGRARAVPARPARARRRGAHCRSRHHRDGPAQCRRRHPDMGPAAAARPGRRSSTRPPISTSATARA